MPADTTPSPTMLAERIERCYHNKDCTPMADIYKPDVLLDVHVPQWRFQLQGAAAAIGWFTDTTDNMLGFRVTWTRATATDRAIALEWEVHAGSDDDEHLCREVDLFHLDGDRVAEHVIFCTACGSPPRSPASAAKRRWSAGSRPVGDRYETRVRRRYAWCRPSRGHGSWTAMTRLPGERDGHP